MGHTRSVITVGDILHIEIECPDCKAVTTLPFLDYKGGRAANMIGVALAQCLWCNSPWVVPYRTLLLQLLNTLAEARGTSAPPIRLVLQNDLGKKE